MHKLGTGSKKFDHNIVHTLRELDACLLVHSEWLKELHRTFVCEDQPNPDDLALDADRRCKFGQWYYGDLPDDLRQNSTFKHIGELHRAMHDEARALLLTRLDGRQITLAEYGAFMEHVMAFKREVRTLEFELISQVCATDHLTGVWNRSTMLFKISQEHERAARMGHPCCLVLMDLDHFKKVNDEHGHPAGDLVLQTTMQFFAGKLRKYDSIFRYGGEEFLFCLPNSDETHAETTIERLRADLETLPIHTRNGQILHVTASFGIAALNPAYSVEEAIEAADHALLCAKASGRNQVCVWKN